jgi:small subunit ribosomal protein S24e
MEVEIVAKRENPFLKRLEVEFRVHHPGKQTPKREEVAEAVKKTVNAGNKVIVGDHLDTEFGRPVSRGYAKVYENKEAAAAVEAEHLLVRNKLAEKRVKAAAAPAKAPPKKGA